MVTVMTQGRRETFNSQMNEMTRSEKTYLGKQIKKLPSLAAFAAEISNLKIPHLDCLRPGGPHPF